jgi:hypothetical protein
MTLFISSLADSDDEPDEKETSIEGADESDDSASQD